MTVRLMLFTASLSRKQQDMLDPATVPAVLLAEVEDPTAPWFDCTVRIIDPPLFDMQDEDGEVVPTQVVISHFRPPIDTVWLSDIEGGE